MHFMRASSVMGVSVCGRAESIWCDGGSCRRVSGVMCTFRWLREQKT